MTSFETALLNNYLPDYYKKLFPFKVYTKWLCYGQKPTDYFAKREFAFILEDDVHLRYRSFAEQSEFEKELCRISPHKIDIGAVYNYNPKDHKKHPDFHPVQRELVFDIDLTDYDGVRTCCQEAKVCSKCWKFIALAVKILDYLLEDNFGFVSRMWVFSGRRGVHCWIGDAQARSLSNVGRAAIAEYLSLIVGEKLELCRKRTVNLHPMINIAYRTAMDSGIIDQMVMEQGWLSPEKFPSILNHIEDTDLKRKIQDQAQKLNVSDLWTALKIRFDEKERKKAEEEGKSVPTTLPSSNPHFLKWFVLWHTYPRLDVNVSTGLNHLLKSPFCIHPKTGNVAVPLDVEKIDEFDVNQVPRIDILLRQYSQAIDKQENQENRKIIGYKHTEMAPYVENFEKFVKSTMEETTN